MPSTTGMEHYETIYKLCFLSKYKNSRLSLSVIPVSVQILTKRFTYKSLMDESGVKRNDFDSSLKSMFSSSMCKNFKAVR